MHWISFFLGKKPLSGHLVTECTYIVIYLHHHPIDGGNFIRRIFHRLDDAEDLKTVLSRHMQGQHKIDALLFGHNHEGREWNGSWGIPRVYDAGSTTGKRNLPGPIRVIDLSKDISPDWDLTKDI